MYSIFIVFRLLLKVNLICLKRNSHNVDYETYHYDYFNTFQNVHECTPTILCTHWDHFYAYLISTKITAAAFCKFKFAQECCKRQPLILNMSNNPHAYLCGGCNTVRLATTTFSDVTFFAPQLRTGATLSQLNRRLCLLFNLVALTSLFKSPISSIAGQRVKFW